MERACRGALVRACALACGVRVGAHSFPFLRKCACKCGVRVGAHSYVHVRINVGIRGACLWPIRASACT